MDAISHIRWRGTVGSRGDATSRLLVAGDVVLVSRGGHRRWLVFRCPSNCGEELPINLDARAGPAWRLYNPGPSASLHPSVWRDSGCRVHFILSRGRLWLFEQGGREWDYSGVDEDVKRTVCASLTSEGQNYFDIATMLDLEPWEVLRACRHLVRDGLAFEGRGQHSNCFGRRAP